MTYAYLHTYIVCGGRHLTIVGLAQAHPNYAVHCEHFDETENEQSYKRVIF